MHKTITVGQLLDYIKELPRDLNIYVAADPECNSYSTLSREFSIQYTEDEKSITLVPFEESLQIEDICVKAKERNDLFEKTIKELTDKGVSRDEAFSVAMDKAYNNN
jgi:hypothetical protein